MSNQSVATRFIPDYGNESKRILVPGRDEHGHLIYPFGKFKGMPVILVIKHHYRFVTNWMLPHTEWVQANREEIDRLTQEVWGSHI